MGESFLLTLLVSSYFLSLSAYLLPWDRNISHITEQSNCPEVILHCSSAYFLYFYSFLLVLKVLDNDTKCPSIIIFCLFTEGLWNALMDPAGIPIKSKNIFNLPVHFSLVLGDLIANRNIEYGSVDDSSIPPLSSNTLLFLSFVFARGILIEE